MLEFQCLLVCLCVCEFVFVIVIVVSSIVTRSLLFLFVGCVVVSASWHATSACQAAFAALAKKQFSGAYLYEVDDLPMTSGGFIC